MGPAHQDLRGHLLTVRGALQRERNQLRLGETKTRHSRRALNLPGPVIAVLRHHRSRQDLLRQELGDHWHDQDLVFPTDLGTLMDPSNLRRDFSRLTKRAGLGHWHPHELRHSTASLLSAAGVPLEHIADVLGHAGTNVTSAVYRHQVRPSVDAGVTPMEELFGDHPDQSG